MSGRIRRGVDNLAVLGEAREAAQQAVVQATAAAVRSHGVPPMHRRVAASHEAGHAVVARAIGWTPTRVRVFRTRLSSGVPAWLGETTTREADRTVDARDPAELPWLLRSALLTLGGDVGERHAGLGHDAANIEETYVSQSAAVSAALHLGLDARELWAAVRQLAGAVLARNAHAHAAIAQALMLNGGLRRERLDVLLRDVEVLDPVALIRARMSPTNASVD